MHKNQILTCVLFAISLAALAQEASSIPTNKELAARAKSVYVDSETFYMKRERLEGCLLKSDEFKAWNLQITNNKNAADLWVEVKRIPFTNHFTYTVTDRNTEIIIMAGKVDSLGGTVYQMISDRIIHTMKEFRGDPLPQQEKKQASN
jgi:hypothetical protein